MNRRPILVAVALLSLAAVGAALFTQHVWGMQPCPWCVLQRAIFCLIAIVALAGALLPGALQLLMIVLVLVVADLGVAAALWQHFVAAEQASCVMTLADRIMGASGLDALWPEVFMATAACAEKVRLFGLPYEFWSGALFSFISLVAIWLLVQGLKRRR